MGVFHRKYREPLQAVVDHARRFRELLEWLEARHPDPARWLVGRREEVGLVVHLRVRDWRADRIGLECAARTIGAYLDEVPLGAARSLGLPANVPLDCCAADEAITLPLGGERGPATHVEPRSPRDTSARETWVDLGTLLDLGPSVDGVVEATPNRDREPRVPTTRAQPRANRS